MLFIQLAFSMSTLLGVVAGLVCFARVRCLGWYCCSGGDGQQDDGRFAVALYALRVVCWSAVSGWMLPFTLSRMAAFGCKGDVGTWLMNI